MGLFDDLGGTLGGMVKGVPADAQGATDFLKSKGTTAADAVQGTAEQQAYDQAKKDNTPDHIQLKARVMPYCPNCPKPKTEIHKTGYSHTYKAPTQLELGIGKEEVFKGSITAKVNPSYTLTKYSGSFAVPNPHLRAAAKNPWIIYDFQNAEYPTKSSGEAGFEGKTEGGFLGLGSASFSTEPTVAGDHDIDPGNSAPPMNSFRP